MLHNSLQEMLPKSLSEMLQDYSQLPYSGPKVEQGDVRVEIVDMPEGPLLYKRLSLMYLLPGFVPPKGSKLLRDVVNIGYMHGAQASDRGPRDGGFYDILVRTKDFIAVDTIDRIMKAAVWNYRTYHCNDYYTMSSYRDGLHLWQHEDTYLHLLQSHGPYLEKAYIPAVTVTKVERVNNTPLYQVRLEYKQMPDWNDYLEQPIVIRQSCVEIARAFQIAAEAEKQLGVIQREAAEFQCRIVEAQRRTAEAERDIAIMQLNTSRLAMSLFWEGKITLDQMTTLSQLFDRNAQSNETKKHPPQGGTRRKRRASI